MCFKKYRKSSESLHKGIVVCIGLFLVLAQLIVVPVNSAQTRKRRPVNKIERKASSEKADPIARAMTTICGQRKRDPQGSIPIDEMASMQSLPLTNRRVLAGKLRAQGLLPMAKRLVPFALRRVAAKVGLSPLSLSSLMARLQAVNTIKAEVDKRDNSSWRPSEPSTIVFGTIFLTGLRSDEAMIAVLAHELTHAINGTDQSLHPIFTGIRTKAAQAGRPVSGAAAVELGCEMVGLEVLRDYIGQTGRRGKTSRRLARAFHKDCVQRDLADENHLSPRETMRLLLILDPEVTNSIVGQAQRKQSRKRRR